MEALNAQHFEHCKYFFPCVSCVSPTDTVFLSLIILWSSVLLQFEGYFRFSSDFLLRFLRCLKEDLCFTGDTRCGVTELK